MTDEQWLAFFTLARETLGEGSWDLYSSESWCACTCFGNLRCGANYFNCGVPPLEDLKPQGLRDGGLWRHEYRFADLAHVLLPRPFYRERMLDGQFSNGEKTQDVDALAAALTRRGVPHRCTDLLLEIKLY